MLPTPPSILVLVLLQAPVAAESPPPVADCEDVQRIELSFVSTAAIEVCVSPGLMTGLRFDAPVTVDLQDDVRFEEVVRARQLLTLVPPPDMMPGDRIRLTVRFEDAVPQQRATLVLVGHRGQATHQVEVYRDKRTRESYQQEIEQEHARNQQLREENQRLSGELEHLRARLNQSVGLLGLYINGVLGLSGIQSTLLSEGPPVVGGLSMSRGTSYRANDSVAVELWLLNSSAEPWTAEGASLVTAKGEKLERIRIYQPEAIPPNEMRRVFIEVPATRKELQGQVTLNLWEAGPRTLSIPELMFP
ncbi:uncharacterized protein (TIGR02268 family) [Archangium gephyra]|uniref:Uncharacterized protein (TIGR02268 family) n=1 Tax=Archangium gephyra TaxID=48 RepID=A0ABX9JUP8_9BACT|nr:DUF2381 family protein [Archangium gephyra]REG27294.1 uncharacterized protein (TIGR02268 family) [Archangium gephyra]